MAEEGEYYLLSATRQMELLRSQGLSFQDSDSAYLMLNNVSLFRLEVYLRPLRMSDGNGFKDGATFERACILYDFDSALRGVVSSALAPIEISVRTQLQTAVMEHTNDPYWFIQPSNFTRGNFVNTLTERITKELERNDEEPIGGYYRQHGRTMPPSWIVMEVISFGTLSLIYNNLSDNNLRRNIANYYGLSETVMESWLHSTVYVRNICAHHNRLWNKRLQISPVVPRHCSLSFLETIPRTDRTYFVMSIILYFLKIIKPCDTFADRVKALLAEYPQIDVRAMGFPDGWEVETLWQ